MIVNKKIKSRIRRSRKTRASIRDNCQVRLTIHRSSKHIYAQIISSDGTTVLAAASSLDKTLQSELSSTGNVDAAKAVGSLVAKRGKEAGIIKVAFDRSGFRYHGRIKALADAARESGLEF
jgi:large subunit ribosomal protein L18